ncbi:hypothetical protein [Kitasatospora sp. NPDC056184]|uniref:hypothetical protein n=1 Tax=Kitasatospora sp. NPDC056184 TaxID=3345738 RepID=UPI0035DA485A
MESAAKYAIPAVALAFLLVFAAFFGLQALLTPHPPPSVVGQWRVGQGPSSTRLELVDGGRLGPSVIPASVCREDSTSPAIDDLWEITNGTWEASRETDAGYQVHIDFVGPTKCHIMLANTVQKGGKHTLRYGRLATEWTLVRP